MIGILQESSINRKLLVRSLCLVAFFLTANVVKVFSQTTYFTQTSGPWNQSSTWSTIGFGNATNTGTFPVAGDIVNIGGGFTVTVTGNESCSTLTFEAGTANNNTLTINTGNSLTASGAVTIPQATAPGANVLDAGAGTLNAASVSFTNGSAGGTGHRITIGTGTVTVTGNVSGTGTSSTIQFTGAGLLQLGGTLYTAATGTLTTFAGSTVEYNAVAAQTIQAFAYQNLTLTGSGSNKTMAANFNIGGNVSVGSGATFTIGAFTTTITGTTTVNGTLAITSATGTKTFTGLVTVNGTWNNNTANEAVTLQGGLTNNGTFNAGTGVYTFSTASPQTLTGNFSIPSVTVTGVVLNNTNTLTVGTALAGTGALVQASTAVLNVGGTSTITTLTATASGNIVNYTSAVAQTIKGTSYDSIALSGGNKSLGAATVIARTFKVPAGMTLTANQSLTANSSTIIDGTITYGVTGTKIFVGSVTISSGGTWDNTANEGFTFRGGLINSGTFTGGTSGVYLFDTNVQALTGTLTIPSVTVTGVTLTNNNSLTVGTALAGTGTLTQTGSAVLNIGGTSTITTLTATASGNIVNYTSAVAQTIKGTSYDSIALSGGNKSLGAAIVIARTFKVPTGMTLTANQSLTANSSTIIDGTITYGVTGTKIFVGSVTISSGGTWDNTANEGFTFRGGLINSGTFTGGTSGVYLFDTNVQALTGILSIPNVTVTGVTLTNNNSLTVGTALTGTGTLTQALSAALSIGGTSTITTLTATAIGNTVSYTGGAAQTIHAGPYHHLTLSGAGAKTVAVALTIAGDLTLSSGTPFTAGAFTHNVGGNWINNGSTFTNTGSTISLNGSTQSIGGSASTTFNNLTLSGGTKTFAVSTTIGSTLAISSGAVASLSSSNSYSANALSLGGGAVPSGNWGSSSSSPPAVARINDTFFAGTGYVAVATGASFTYYTISTGNWNQSSTWSTVGFGSGVNAGTFPVAGDAVNIGGGFTITVTGNELCSTLTFEAGTANNNTLSINTGNSLTASGAVTIPQATAPGVNILDAGAGTLNAASVSFTNGSAGGTGHRITIGTGTVTVTGNVTGTGTSSTIQFTGAGLLQLGGTLYTAATGTLTTFAGSTVEYNAVAAQTIQAFAYQNLTLTGNGSNKTMAANFNIGGNVSVGSGATFTIGAFTTTITGTTTVDGTLTISSNVGTKILTGLVTINSGGTWNNSGNEGFTLRGGITNNGGTFTGGTTGTYLFDTNDQSLTGTLSIPTITVTGIQLTNNGPLTVATSITLTAGPPNGTLVNNSTISLGSSLTANNGTVTNNSASSISTVTTAATNGTINNNGALTVGTNLTGTGTLIQGTNATLSIGGTSTITTLTATAAGNTVTYNGAAAQTVHTGDYYNLTFSGSTKTFSAATAIAGTLSISSGAIANLGVITTHTANALTLAGVTQVSGTWGSTTSGATNQNNTFFAGTGRITVANGSNTFYSIASSDWSANTTWSNTGFGGPVAGSTPGAGALVNIGGNFAVTVNGSESCASLSFDQTTAASNSLTISGNLSVSGVVTIPRNGGSNTLAVGAGTLTAAGLDFTVGTASGTQAMTIGTGTATVSGNITGVGVSSTIQFTGAGKLQIGGAMFTPANGTLTVGSGTVEYNGAAQTVQPFAYQNLTISGSGTKTVASAQSVSSNLTLTSGILSITSSNLSISSGGTIVVDGGSISNTSPTGGPWNVTYIGSSKSTSLEIPSSGNIANITVSLNASQTLTLASAVNLTGLLNITNNDNSVQSSGNLTLISTASNTAAIGNLGLATDNRKVLGSVNVQRYFGIADNVDRFISSPVATAWVAQLQSSAPMGSFPVTGNFPESDFPGNPACTDNRPSLTYYREFDPGILNIGYKDWVTSNLNTLEVGVGYDAYMWNGVNNTTVTFQGAINSGDLPLGIATKGPGTTITRTNNGSSADGWNLVGNPYPSAVQWNTTGWNRTNIDQTIWVWNVMGRVWYSWDAVNSTGTLPNGLLAIAQAFWVYVPSGTSGSLTIKEQSKSSSVTASYYRTRKPDYLEIVLSGNGTKESSFLMPWSNDAKGNSVKPEFGFEKISIALVSQDIKYGHYTQADADEVIPVYVNMEEAGDYSISFASEGQPAGLVNYYLVDKETRSFIQALPGNSYSFTTTDKSPRSSRFYLTKNPDQLMTNVDKEAKVRCYPNPTSGQLAIEINSADVQNVSLINITGTKLGQIDLHNDDGITSGKLDMSQLSPGVYMIMGYIHGKVFLERVIKY